MWSDKERIKSNISGHLHERNDRQSIMRTIQSIFGQFLGTNGIFEYSRSYWWQNAPEIASKSYMIWRFYQDRFIDRKSSALFNLSKLSFCHELDCISTNYWEITTEKQLNTTEILDKTSNNLCTREPWLWWMEWTQTSKPNPLDLVVKIKPFLIPKKSFLFFKFLI